MSQILIPPNQDIQNRVVTPDENGLVIIRRDNAQGPQRFFYRFTGTAGDRADLVPWTPGAHPFTIEFDMLVISSPATGWALGDLAIGGPVFRHTTANLQFAYQRTEGVLIDTVLAGFPLGVIFHVLIRQQAGRYDSDVNGTLNSATGTSSLGSILHIGNRSGNDQPFDGYIANLSLLDEGDAGNSSFYPMDEGTGDKFIDQGGRGASITIVGNFSESNWDFF